MPMEKEKNNEITPFRIKQIMQAAADITDRLVNGKYLYNPSYHECEITIELVAEALKKGKTNTGGSKDVSK